MIQLHYNRSAWQCESLREESCVSTRLGSNHPFPNENTVNSRT